MGRILTRVSGWGGREGGREEGNVPDALRNLSEFSLHPSSGNDGKGAATGDDTTEESHVLTVAHTEGGWREGGREGGRERGREGGEER